jgi:hypothetical protein
MSSARFTQYVFRVCRCAMTVVLDEPGDRLLLMRRHRFIVDRWVWELPGGYVDDGGDSLAAAASEVEEETGWHPHGLEFVLSCQPLIGNADYPQDLYLARGAELVGEPDADETAEVGGCRSRRPRRCSPGVTSWARSPSSVCSVPCCGAQPLVSAVRLPSVAWH